MTEVKREHLIYGVLKKLPKRMFDEVFRLAASRPAGISALRELRVRTSGICTALLESECIPLAYKIRSDEMIELVRDICDGALYANRDNISSGYVSLEGGIRVGIIGTAKYEKGVSIGVSNISSLMFRFPHSECAFGDELFEIWKKSPQDGMLIYSPPGVGKTTALRTLATKIGSGESALQVAVVDERCEFSECDSIGARVDVLRGYHRKEGIEIATRTMSPDVVIIDELGAADASGIAEVVRCGVPLLASVHAGSYGELSQKSLLSPLISCGAFTRFVGISRCGDKYSLELNEI